MGRASALAAGLKIRQLGCQRAALQKLTRNPLIPRVRG